ncbi:sensor histidine kinase [Streptomyces olivaceoviridis]|uniref:histidine kinase n=1 Tax=Streptomyces olivaceoviridis TaxID=1921 RepID=A0ABW7VI69_STROI|nr:ATP-binding protein [Streptomyces corchorusii]
MSDHAAPVTARSSRQRGAHASDDARPAPAFTASCFTACTLGGGWLLDRLEVVPALAAVMAAGAVTGSLLWWSAVRSISARRSGARVRAEYEASLRKWEGSLRTLGDVVVAAEKGGEVVRWASEQVERGKVHTDLPPPTAYRRTGNASVDAVAVVQQVLEESWQAVMKAATHQRRMLNDRAELAEVFTSIAPRLQSLVNRSIAAITEAERTIEDPELLDAVFRVDHLLTQIRRDAESLAVLGGSAPSRDSAPVLVVTAVRRAVAEIPEYARVRVGPTGQRAAVPGYVSPNLVHLLAALMENATDFSHDKVEVFIHQAGTGIAIEVLDRGTGMSQDKREALNRLLAAPETEDLRVRLREGKIGLLVAAQLARRHGITIELGPNIVGGTRAVVVIPPNLLVSADVPSDTPPPPRPRPFVPAAPSQQSHASPPAEAAAQRRRSLPSRSTGEATVPVGQDGKRALPRRSAANTRVPPASTQAPAGHPTSNLMADFQRSQTHGQQSAPPSGT